MAENESVESSEPAESSEFELTERELIIAQGGDPDSEEYQDEEVSEDIEEPDHSEDSEEVEGSTEDEDQEEVEVGDDWITESTIKVADAYGVSDDELVEFKDEESFLSAVSLLDGRAEDADETDESEEPEEDISNEDFLDRIEQLREAGYEDDVLDLFREQHETTSKEREANKNLRDEIASIKERQEGEALATQAMEFHNLVDDLDEERFGLSYSDGKYQDISKEHDSNREKLWNAMDTITSGIYRRAERDGQEPELPSDKVLAHRAMMLAFGDEIKEDETKKISRRIQTQSKRRRPVGSAARKEAPVASADKDSEDIANDPRLVEFWEKSQQ